MRISSVSRTAVRRPVAIAPTPTETPTMAGDTWSPSPPLNPFRPLFGATTALESAASQGGLVAAVAGVGLLATVPMDLADAVTRPLQVLAWPFAWAWYGVESASNRLGLVGNRRCLRT